MRFYGKNFQAWPEFDLDLTGFVVMVGPSFAGKSSIFRALRGVLRNEITEQRVRHGADKLELELTVDGKTIKAVRKANGSTKYMTDAGDYTSLAKGIPDGLKALNAGEVKIGDYTIDPIFASQFGDQFLLESTGPTELNTVLGAFSSTEKLEMGKKQANLLITQKNAEAKTFAEEIGDAEERRDKLGKIHGLAVVVDASVKSLQPKVVFLESATHWLGQASTTMARLVPLRHLEASLAIPDTSEAEHLQQQVFYLRAAARATRRAMRLTGMDMRLEETINRWNDIVASSRNAKALNETASLARLLEKATTLDAARKLNGVIGEMETLATHANTLQSSIRYTGQAGQSLRRLDAKRNELTALNREISELQVTHGICPKCGKPVEHICGS